jgi:hypothetical protein
MIPSFRAEELTGAILWSDGSCTGDVCNHCGIGGQQRHNRLIAVVHWSRGYFHLRWGADTPMPQPLPLAGSFVQRFSYLPW